MSVLSSVLERLSGVGHSAGLTAAPQRQFFVSLNGRVMLPRKKGVNFVVFEGLEGSGQTTQAEILRDHLEKKGVDVLLTKEPTQASAAGKRIHKALDGEIEISPRELQELFAQDRKEHLEGLIIPAFNGGRTVICDRYFFSSFAYGAADCGLKWLMEVNGNFIYPDAAYVLMVDPEICLTRIAGRGRRPQIFENERTLKEAIKVYEKMARMFDDVYLLDGSQNTEGLFYAILARYPNY